MGLLGWLLKETDQLRGGPHSALDFPPSSGLEQGCNARAVAAISGRDTAFRMEAMQQDNRTKDS